MKISECKRCLHYDRCPVRDNMSDLERIGELIEEGCGYYEK